MSDYFSISLCSLRVRICVLLVTIFLGFFYNERKYVTSGIHLVNLNWCSLYYKTQDICFLDKLLLSFFHIFFYLVLNWFCKNFNEMFHSINSFTWLIVFIWFSLICKKWAVMFAIVVVVIFETETKLFVFFFNFKNAIVTSFQAGRMLWNLFQANTWALTPLCF